MRSILSVVLLILVAGSTQAQSPPRTPWGAPDLGGVWSNATLTPLERPEEWADREVLSDAEIVEVNRTGLERTVDPWKEIEVPFSGELNEVWLELGEALPSGRTSLIVDPPDGRIPYTAEGKARWDNFALAFAGLGPADSHEDRPLGERCLVTGGFYTPNPFYNNNHQIFQAPDHIAILTESFNEVRLIPLDDGGIRDPEIRQWAGSSRGRWEGDVLIIETTNFSGRGSIPASTDQLRTIERLEVIDDQTIDYELTVIDENTFTRPWTVRNTLRRTEGPIYEYACHEGNYGLANILSGARAEEREPAAGSE